MPPVSTPAMPGARPSSEAVMEQVLRQHKSMWNLLKRVSIRSDLLVRTNRMNGLIQGVLSNDVQTRVAPFNIGAIAAGVTAPVSRVPISRPAFLYALSVGAFLPATGQATSLQTRFRLEKSNQDPLNIEPPTSASLVPGPSPFELSGMGLVHPWVFPVPLITDGNDEYVLRSRNESAAGVVAHGALIYGERTAAARVQLKRPVSKTGTLRFLNTAGLAGPAQFLFRRPGRILGFAGFGVTTADTSIKGPAVRLSMSLNNGDLLFTGPTVDRLVFGENNDRVFELPHPFNVDSNSALLVSIANDVIAAPPAVDYGLTIYYDEEL